MEQLSGTTAFVTGGAQGIGLSIARALARAGVKVAIADIDAAALATAERELSATTEVATTKLNVRDRDAFAHAVDEVETRLGPVSILCNNAGVAVEPLLDHMSFETWDLVLGVNLGGVVNGIQTVVPRMVERGIPAHIVNTASAAGLATVDGTQNFMYTTSKFGVVGLSEALRSALEPRGVGVSVLCPGFFATNLAETSRASVHDALPPERARELDPLFDAFADRTAQLGRDPDDIGELVLTAIRENQRYILTDRLIEQALTQRTQRLLAAMPPETEYDRAVQAAVAAAIEKSRATRR